MEENTLLLRREGGSTATGRKVKFAEGAILVTITLERLAFYSLAGNLVLFLNIVPYEWESVNSMYALLYFFGISYLMSFLGGLLADTLLGRFKTLLLSLLIYVIGYTFLLLLPGRLVNKGTSKEHEILPKICGHSANSSSTDVTLKLIYDKSPFSEQCSGLIFGVLTLIAIGSGPFRSNIAPFGADQVCTLYLM
jgi:peptide/histidine transporter 3/4